MSRKTFIAGNWKMNTTKASAVDLARAIAKGCPANVTLGVAPPFVYLDAVSAAVAGSLLLLGAQDAYFEENGAFTGEISPEMLVDIGCNHVILGHSERRTIFGETDDLVSKKLRASLDAGLKPIVCIGETEGERERNETESVLLRHIGGSLVAIGANDAAKIVIAYEPIWAIGTGKTATPEQAQAAHKFIRGELKAKFGTLADAMLILYGGSIKPENAESLFRCPDIDGGLVGGASLDAGGFIAIVESASL